MKISKLLVAMVVVAGLACSGTTEAGWPPIKSRSLGKYQQQTLARGFGAAVGAGVTYATGSATVGSAVGHGAGNHAAKKWTGKGLQNWKNPKRW